MKIKILVPIYNDWQSLSKLIDEINSLSLSPEFQLSIMGYTLTFSCSETLLLSLSMAKETITCETFYCKIKED